MPNLRILADRDALAEAARAHFVLRARECVRAEGRFTVALAGGSTPRALYQLLAREPELPWERILLCFGDERPVPPDHPDSNARMVRESLTDAQPRAQLHRIPGELPPERAARLYAQTLLKLFGDVDFPRFDLVLLGLGADGHTASLFPHSPALAERTAWVRENPVASLASTRITLTFPVLKRAADVLFLVSGGDKAWALCEVLEGRASVEDIPARGIAHERATTFLVDAAAARDLTPP